MPLILFISLVSFLLIDNYVILVPTSRTSIQNVIIIIIINLEAGFPLVDKDTYREPNGCRMDEQLETETNWLHTHCLFAAVKSFNIEAHLSRCDLRQNSVQLSIRLHFSHFVSLRKVADVRKMKHFLQTLKYIP